jgi:DNA replication and repair protein RecF
MSRLTQLSVSHFRSHRRAALELDGRPVALFGPNGAGKTNLLEAVSLLSPGRGLRRAAAEELARRPEAIGWKITARVEAPGNAHEIETVAEGSAARSVRIDGKAATQTRLGGILRMVWLTPAMDRIWIEGASERRRFLDRATLSFDPNHAERSLAYEKAMRERNRLLKDDVRDRAWHAALEARMAEAGAAIARARVETVARLAAAQADAGTAFPAAEIAAEGETERRFAEDVASGADATEAEGRTADWLRGALAEGRGRDFAAGRALAGPHRTDLTATYAAKGTEARLCSTGEQKALLVSLVLANARALTREAGAPPVLLLDEVAAHLDADRRAALYDEIAALGAQAWLTAAGRELFAPLEGRAQIFEIREGEEVRQGR